MRSNLPLKSTTGSVHSRRSSAICSSSRASGTEVLAQGLVLDVVPADPHTETQPPPRQQVDVRSLPSDQGGLALREDQDAGDEADALGHSGEVGEHHQRVVERIALGVGTDQGRDPVLVHCTKHVVIGQQMIEAERLGRPPDAAHRLGVTAQLDLRINHTDLHGPHPATNAGSIECSAASTRRCEVHLRVAF
jgi:hypothetical protein